MSKHIEFMNGTGVEVSDQATAEEVCSAALDEHESTSDYEAIRVSMTPNDDGGWTVALNFKDTGYTEDTAPQAQKDDFETMLNNLHTAVSLTGAADRMRVIDS